MSLILHLVCIAQLKCAHQTPLREVKLVILAVWVVDVGLEVITQRLVS